MGLHKLLHLLPAETAHNAAIWSLKNNASPKYPTPQKSVEVFGLKFPNPIGMAAGFDKNGEAVNGLFNLGFGFVEIGTITPRPQAGNPKPRIFRLSEDKAIINRLGFNNKGIDFLLAHVEVARQKGFGNGILGINIGANKDTDNFIKDYVKLVPLVSPLADYITINISSPNTPGLRDLQHGEKVKKLVSEVINERDKQTDKRPILVKIAPDLGDDQLEDIIKILQEEGADGVIATNTTIARPETLKNKNAKEVGGLSGAPLTQASTDIIKKIKQISGGNLPIVAVGGVANAQQAKEKLDAGASLVQVYTGLIYEGPKIVQNICKEL